MANSTKGLFGQWFSGKRQGSPNSKDPEHEMPGTDNTSASEANVPMDSSLTSNTTAQSEEEMESEHSTENTPEVKQTPLFPEAGHIWDDYSDPLYLKPKESSMIQECSSFVYDLEKKYKQELEHAEHIQRQLLLAAKAEKARQEAAQKRAASQGDHDDGTDSSTDPTSPEEETRDAGAEAAEEIVIDRDLAMHIHLSSDSMAAWLYILPPSGKGAGISTALLQDTLKKSGVNYGLIQDNIRLIVEKVPIRQPILIARGLPAKDGIDGTVTDHFKRQITQEFVEDSKGNINFKQLNNIQQVENGDVICDITPAVPGEPGKNVVGATVTCRIPGKDAAIPQGGNTWLSEDRRQLLARIDGHLQFKNNLFLIDPVLKIPGNVDGTTGNLDFKGDINIGGDVRNGFSVKATGSIYVRGSVEGAVLEAGKDIHISSGVTGNGRATISAGGSIKCKYLEHCTATALSDIQAESIVLCQIQCNRNVDVSSGIGAIIGGKIVAASSIRAKSIGSKSRHITTLVIGTPFKAVEERHRAEQELKQIDHNLSELNKNITYLQSDNNSSKKHMLGQLIEARDIISARKIEVEEILATLDENTFDLKSCRIICTRLFPVSDFQIGAATLRVNDEYSSCNIYYSDDNEIVIGSQ